MAQLPAGEKREPARILVVDDDPGVREVTVQALRNYGWHAEGARDGLEAIGRLQHRGFDVVVTDLEMPRLDGLALLREVRRMERPLPVVVQTSVLDKNLESRLRRAEAFRVLVKGPPLRDLVRSVGEACAASMHHPAHCA